MLTWGQFHPDVTTYLLTTAMTEKKSDNADVAGLIKLYVSQVPPKSTPVAL